MLFMQSFKLTFTYQLNDFPNTFPFDEEKKKCSNTGVGETRTNKTPSFLDGGTESFLSFTDARK